MNNWLKRAASEFAVVVLGVLVALSADRWVQGLDERAHARYYLERLATDLRLDSARLVEGIELQRARERAGRAVLLAAADPSTPIPDSTGLVRGFLRVGWFNKMSYANATWTELVSAGRTSLIRNSELRTALSTHFQEREVLATTEADWEWIFGLLEQRTMMVSPDIRQIAQGDPVPGVDQVLSAVRGDRQLSSLINQAILTRVAAASLYQAILDETIGLLRALDAERGS